MKQFNCFLFLCILVGNLYAQNTFTNRYHFDFPATYFSGLIATDSCYYVTGIVADSIAPYQPLGLFTKFNLDGTLDTLQTLKMPGSRTTISRPTLSLLTDNHFITVGVNVDTTVNTLIAHFNHHGDTIQTNQFENLTNPGLYMRPMALAIKGDRMLIATEEVEAEDLNDADVVLTYMNTNGELIWRQRYNSNDLYETPNVIITDENNHFIIGCRYSNISVTNFFYQSQNYIFAVDTLGSVKWQYATPSTILMDGANSIAVTDDGGLVVATGFGEEERLSDVSSRLWWKSGVVYKLNASHQKEWEVEFVSPDPSYDTQFSKILVASDGSGYLAGGNFYQSHPDTSEDFHGWLVKVSPEGDSLWSRKLRFFPTGWGGYQHFLYDLEETAAGGYILSGQAVDYSAPLQHQQAWLIKVDEYGCLVPDCQLVSTQEAFQETGLSLLLYPNPVQTELSIFVKDRHINRRQKTQLQVVNLQGQVMQAWEAGRLEEVTHIVSVAGYPAGAYFVNYVAEGKVVRSERFVKR